MKSWTVKTVVDKEHDPYGFMKKRFVCPHCGDWQTYGKTPFCPYCGQPVAEGEEAEECQKD